jgi:hypothetical protein
VRRRRDYSRFGVVRRHGWRRRRRSALGHFLWLDFLGGGVGGVGGCPFGRPTILVLFSCELVAGRGFFSFTSGIIELGCLTANLTAYGRDSAGLPETD